jgi:electron transfer flavoprotein alpha subunit
MSEPDRPTSAILAFSERPDVAKEMLAAARQLADGSALRVVSLVIGEDGAARATEEIAFGADKVVVASGQSPNTSTVLEVLHDVVQKLEPSFVLIGSTRVGSEVSARLGQRLRVASASECLALELDESGDLVVERFVYGGRFVAKRVLRSAPKLAAVQVGRYEPLPRADDRSGEIEEVSPDLLAPAVSVIERKEPERSEADIGKAEVIISAGRGLKSREDLALLQSLARALGGELAGSRPLVEMQWISRDRQVGLSGRTVSPRLYVACGVSGQIEHIAGMRPSHTVVAINTSPDAPIHHEADYSIVDDLYEVIPALVSVLEEGRSRAAGAEQPGAPGQSAGELEPA